MILTTLIDTTQYKGLIISHIDDIIMANNDKDILQVEKEKLIQNLRNRGWTINMDKTIGSSVKQGF